MFKLGLEGNICAGKSEVEKILSELGFYVVDLDKVVDDFYKNNKKIQNKILKKFNTLNKKEIASIVFKDKNKKQELEGIFFPVLLEFIKNEFKKDYDKICISGALLYEAGFYKFFDKVIYIDASYDLRLKRLQKRNNLSLDEAKLRLDSQKDNGKHADIIIQNNSTIEELRKKLKKIILKSHALRHQ